MWRRRGKENVLLQYVCACTNPGVKWSARVVNWKSGQFALRTTQVPHRTNQYWHRRSTRDRTMLAEHAWNIPSPTENWYSGPSGYAMTLFVSTTGSGAPVIPLPQSPVPGVPGCLGGGGGSTNIDQLSRNNVPQTKKRAAL